MEEQLNDQVKPSAELLEAFEKFLIVYEPAASLKEADATMPLSELAQNFAEVCPYFDGFEEALSELLRKNGFKYEVVPWSNLFEFMWLFKLRTANVTP